MHRTTGFSQRIPTVIEHGSWEAPAYVRPAPAASPADQRRAVKAIAAECDASINRYKATDNETLNENLHTFQGQLAYQKERLDALRAQRLSAIQPSSTMFRSLRSGAVVAAGSASCATAAVAASAAAVAQVGAGLIGIPLMAIVKLEQGASAGFRRGAGCSDSIVMKAPGALIGAGVGAVGGAVGGAIGQAIDLVPSMVERGSLTKKAFRGINRLPAALAHVRRKSRSTGQIADETDRKLAAGLDAMAVKYQEVRPDLGSGYVEHLSRFGRFS